MNVSYMIEHKKNAHFVPFFGAELCSKSRIASSNIYNKASDKWRRLLESKEKVSVESKNS